jgi:hypothetical protein
MQLALKSKSKTQRYGSLLLKDGVIIGRGYNHRNNGIELIDMRKGNLGNHAEVHALDDALRGGFDVRGSTLYAAGYFPNTGLLFIREELSYSCEECPVYLQDYGVVEIRVPLLTGWGELRIYDALSYARKFKKNNEDNLLGRKKESKIKFFIEELLNIL